MGNEEVEVNLVIRKRNKTRFKSNSSKSYVQSEIKLRRSIYKNAGL